MIDGCSDCGTFQRIPLSELEDMNIKETICENCLRERVDNDQLE